MYPACSTFRMAVVEQLARDGDGVNIKHRHIDDEVEVRHTVLDNIGEMEEQAEPEQQVVAQPPPDSMESQRKRNKPQLAALEKAMQADFQFGRKGETAAPLSPMSPSKEVIDQRKRAWHTMLDPLPESVA